MKFLFCLFFLVCSIQAVNCAGDPPPAPPLLVDAPEFSRWTITTLGSPGEDGEPRKGTRRTVFKAGAKRREVTVSRKGAKSEVYMINGLSFQKLSGLAKGDIVVESAGSSGDFPELSWVSAENYVRTDSHKGRKFHVYAWSPPQMQFDSDGRSRQTGPAKSGGAGGNAMEAWIDAKTRLPAKLVLSRYQRVYEFARSRPEDAEPSEEIRRRVESYFGANMQQ